MEQRRKLDKGQIVNPWLAIPHSDYEGHMSSPDVGQLQWLNGLFARMYREFRPRHLLYVGCAGGNGLEHIVSDVTAHAVGIDINREYLSIAQKRYADHIPGLALCGANAERLPLRRETMDFVWCALVLEYVHPARAFAEMAGCLAPGGVLCCVLQLPSAMPAVSETPFVSLALLAPLHTFVDPSELSRLASLHGLLSLRSWEEELLSGKRFSVLLFQRKAK